MFHFKVSRFFLALCLAFNVSCIHTNSYESKPVISANEKPSYKAVLKNPKMRIKNLIYSDEKYPLEDFLSQLARGRFVHAFKKIRISYTPSNSDSEILKNLLNSGLVPVLVNVKNNSRAPLTISYDEFYLAGANGRYRSLNPERLPSHIRQFSPGAVAANVFNVTVVVAVALMMVLLVAHSDGQILNADFSEEKVLNPTEKVTHVDYQRFVIRKTTLAPGQEVTGLVFFSLESMADTDGFALDYLPAY